MDFYLQKLGFEYPKKSFLLQMKSNTNSIKVFRLLFGKINSFFYLVKCYLSLIRAFVYSDYNFSEKCLKHDRYFMMDMIDIYNS